MPIEKPAVEGNADTRKQEGRRNRSGEDGGKNVMRVVVDLGRCIGDQEPSMGVRDLLILLLIVDCDGNPLRSRVATCCSSESKEKGNQESELLEVPVAH